MDVNVVSDVLLVVAGAVRAPSENRRHLNARRLETNDKTIGRALLEGRLAM